MGPIYTCRLSGKLAGQTMECVVHLGQQDGFNYTKQQIADNIFTRLTGQFVFLQVQQFAWTQFAIKKTYVEDDVEVKIPLNQGGQLPETTQYMLPMTAVFQKQTLVGGRRGRGRLCLPGPPTTACEAGRLTQGYVNLMQQVRNSIVFWFLGPNPGTHLHMVLVPSPPRDEQWIAVHDFVPRDYPGTQVRRNFLRGS